MVTIFDRSVSVCNIFYTDFIVTGTMKKYMISYWKQKNTVISIFVPYRDEKKKEKAHHNNLFDCKSANFQLIGEKRIGFLSIFKFECNMCKETMTNMTTINKQQTT